MDDKAFERYPELATNEFWRAAMKKARLAKGWRQEDLGAKVGVTQPMISAIESGESGSSRAIIPISEALGIAPPQVMVEDELEQRWIEAGRFLRSRNLAGLEGLLAAAERMIERSDKK